MDLKKFNVTFTQNNKYNPITRTILVEATNENKAKEIIVNEYGSFNKDGEYSKKITIKEVVECKTDDSKE